MPTCLGWITMRLTYLTFVWLVVSSPAWYLRYLANCRYKSLSSTSSQPVPIFFPDAWETVIKFWRRGTLQGFLQGYSSANPNPKDLCNLIIETDPGCCYWRGFKYWPYICDRALYLDKRVVIFAALATTILCKYIFNVFFIGFTFFY